VEIVYRWRLSAPRAEPYSKPAGFGVPPQRIHNRQAVGFKNKRAGV